VISTGIDMESIERVGALAANGRSLERVFTAAEIGYSAERRIPARHLAGRFAAKEACVKALKTGFGAGVYFKDIEVVSAPDGRPKLKLSSKASALLGDRPIFLSIAYQGDIVMAFVLIDAPQGGF
jgi:holo-[acyl-carrier protein] synthase